MGLLNDNSRHRSWLLHVGCCMKVELKNILVVRVTLDTLDTLDIDQVWLRLL
jgi:hypothetical protein